MSAETFTYDVFLSHSTKEKVVVRPRAERLQVAVRDHLTACFRGRRTFPYGQSAANSPGVHA